MCSRTGRGSGGGSLSRLGHGRSGIAGLGGRGLSGGGSVARLVLLEGGLELGLEVVESVQSWAAGVQLEDAAGEAGG